MFAPVMGLGRLLSLGSSLHMKSLVGWAKSTAFRSGGITEKAVLGESQRVQMGEAHCLQNGPIGSD